MGVGDLLGRATRAFTRTGDSVLSSVRAAWPEATGPGTVHHAYPIRRSRAGVVTVACSDAVWAQEMDMQGDDIARRVNALLGDPDAVAGLRFVVADHAIPQVDTGPPPRRIPPPPAQEAVAWAEQVTEDIDDPDLRALVTRAAARARERDNRS